MSSWFMVGATSIFSEESTLCLGDRINHWYELKKLSSPSTNSLVVRTGRGKKVKGCKNIKGEEEDTLKKSSCTYLTLCLPT